ncbi:MAG: purine nucleoside permease [Pseudomonadota bacterium]
MRVIHGFLLAILLIFGTVGNAFAAESKPMPIKVVVMAMFERGEPTGDSPGELQFWLERGTFDEQHEFVMGEADLYTSKDGVMVVLLGGGIPNATASVMALGVDPRFDFSKAYWLVAGISGADPDDLSLGSAAWARHVVDGDLLYEIDGREIPSHWPYGMVPLGAKEPTQNPEDVYGGWTLDTISFSLNPGLVQWAYDLTRDITLNDAPGMREFRKQYAGYAAAQRPPFVTIGDTLSSSTYWHGELLNTWANDWLKLYAGKDANFMTSNMEDSGTLTALHRLDRAGYVDAERVLVLRTASNFTMPPKGKTAAWSKTAPYPDDGIPSMDAAYIVGNTVVQALVQGWDAFEDTLPQQAAPKTMIDPASMPGQGIQ